MLVRLLLKYIVELEIKIKLWLRKWTKLHRIIVFQNDNEIMILQNFNEYSDNDLPWKQLKEVVYKDHTV